MVHAVRVEVVRWVDEGFPGWAEAELTEADGSVAAIVEKAPVLDGAGRLTPDGPFPVALVLPCDVLRRSTGPDGSRTAVVRLRSGVTDRHGRATFHVGEPAVITLPE